MLEEKIKKILKKIKLFLKNPKEVIKFILPIIILIGLLYPVPYYIKLGGGSISLNDKIKVAGEIKSSGSFNALYVSESKGNVLTFLLSYIVPSFERVKQEKITLENETNDEYNYREKLYFTNSTDVATKIAYSKAGKEVSIKDNKLLVLYIDKQAKTTLKTKDEIISIENKKVKEYSDIENIIKTKKINDKVNVLVKRNNKRINAVSRIIEIENSPKLGIAIANILSYKTNPKLSSNFEKSQTGPSGGIMIALTIYNKLTKEDITNGKTIMGTGTISEDGKVGEIGGIKQKLKGASKNKADIVLVPEANYKEALKEQKEKGYKFKLISVTSFDDALNKLRNK